MRYFEFLEHVENDYFRVGGIDRHYFIMHPTQAWKDLAYNDGNISGEQVKGLIIEKLRDYWKSILDSNDNLFNLETKWIFNELSTHFERIHPELQKLENACYDQRNYIYAMWGLVVGYIAITASELKERNMDASSFLQHFLSKGLTFDEVSKWGILVGWDYDMNMAISQLATDSQRTIIHHLEKEKRKRQTVNLLEIPEVVKCLDELKRGGYVDDAYHWNKDNDLGAYTAKKINELLPGKIKDYCKAFHNLWGISSISSRSNRSSAYRTSTIDRLLEKVLI